MTALEALERSQKYRTENSRSIEATYAAYNIEIDKHKLIEADMCLQKNTISQLDDLVNMNLFNFSLTKNLYMKNELDSLVERKILYRMGIKRNL